MTCPSPDSWLVLIAMLATAVVVIVGAIWRMTSRKRYDVNTADLGVRRYP